jgi:hypothetical protein
MGIPDAARGPGLREEYEEMREWVGVGFNPEQFDPALVKFGNPQKGWRIAFADGE